MTLRNFSNGLRSQQSCAFTLGVKVSLAPSVQCVKPLFGLTNRPRIFCTHVDAERAEVHLRNARLNQFQKRVLKTAMGNMCAEGIHSASSGGRSTLIIESCLDEIRIKHSNLWLRHRTPRFQLQYDADMGDTLAQLDAVLGGGDAARGVEFLINRFREEREWPLLFEARLMKKRLEMGLPMIQTQDPSEFPAALRAEYEQAMVEAAREVGHGFLEAGNIPRAWPYFRAIGEPGPVAEAMDRAKPAEEEVEAVIAIAFQEGVAPAKGLEILLEAHGMCRALTTFGMYAVPKDREKCIALLVRELHAEVVLRMGNEIEARDGTRPATKNLIEMMEGRPELFGEYDYYVDTSHLVTLLPYALEVESKETLGLFHELCAYGKKLAPCFQSKGQSPFENPPVDYGEYVLAMLGNNVEARIGHFRKIVEESDVERVGTAPSQLLVNLLVTLGRFSEALDVAMEHLRNERDLACPSPIQLCRMAGDYERLKELARERNDLLSYVAAFEKK